MENKSKDQSEIINNAEIKEGQEKEQFENVCEQDLGEQNCSNSFGKFANANALLDAYNNLEAQFTKRSQALKRLEKELSALKAEQALSNGNATEVKVLTTSAQDETGSENVAQTVDNASCESEDDNLIASEVALFLERNPSASRYAEAIALKTSERRDVDSGFLERAFISVLEDQVKSEQDKITEDFIYSKAIASPFVKEKIIRDYLSQIITSKGANLLDSSGETVIMPPKKPLSISEAGEMATKVLKRK